MRPAGKKSATAIGEIAARARRVFENLLAPGGSRLTVGQPARVGDDSGCDLNLKSGQKWELLPNSRMVGPKLDRLEFNVASENSGVLQIQNC